MSDNPKQAPASPAEPDAKKAAASSSAPTGPSGSAANSKPPAKQRARTSTANRKKAAQPPTEAPKKVAAATTQAATDTAKAPTKRGARASSSQPKLSPTPEALATAEPVQPVAAKTSASNPNAATAATDETEAPPVAAGFSRRLGDRHLLDSSALEDIDRMTNIALGQLSGGISPASLAMAYLDWMVHLGSSPGKQFQLGAKAMRKAMRLGSYALSSALTGNAEPCIAPLHGDHRFDHPGWQRFPYNVIYQGFLLNQQWWHNATTDVRGISKHSQAAVSFTARQILDMTAPCNVPFLNPEIAEATINERGANLARGATNYRQDFKRSLRNEAPAGVEAFRVGENLAITPGKVVYRNHLIELIQYSPATDSVQREPVLMQSAWMMKYYILDLSPHNSLVKYLVDRGHTVYMVSWLNPGPEHRNLGMEDYRRHGTLAAIDVVAELQPGLKIHAAGYCLGGILLTITAAAMAREGDERLASVTLFTTMTDFTEVGEINVFMDASEVTLLEDMMWQKGYLDHKQVSGGFQVLKSADLIWSKMVREYYLGHREPMFDLMAWNADGTRMPYRQHSELLRRLYVDNELFEGKYMVEGRAISISDIHCPIFAVAAAGDHVAPWHSVYKLHLQSDATELTFVLTSGGHNVGIVNEPGHPHRSYQLSVCHEGDRCIDPETWKERTPTAEGSWWPAWQQWLTRHSSGSEAPPTMGAPNKGYAPLCDSPGSYVLQK